MRINEDKDETMMIMQQGLRRNEDQDATRIKIQGGLRYNEDKVAFSQPFSVF